MNPAKDLIGHHLMRVRIRKAIFERLEEIADEETIRTNEHVTVSDLVRASIYNYLLLHESVRRFEAALEEGEVVILTSPLL
jgi:hypothetical protein